MLSEVPPEVQQGIIEFLQRDSSPATVTNFSFVGGGSINKAGKLGTSAGEFFLKWNEAQKFPGMFEAEVKGLTLLRAPGVIYIPKVVHTGETSSFQYLLLEFITPSARGKKYWEHLGQQLAALHRVTAARFGLDHANYIGSLPQHNTPTTTWVAFYIEQRLTVQVKLACDAHRVDARWTKMFEALYKRLPELLPEELPALLHGDLWSGNLLANAQGAPCLVDPAVYFGHREAELAMTQLFGGFDNEFYEAYHHAYPLQPGFERRVDLYTLYPLLVHVNLFGGSYVGAVENVLRKYT
ncbi:fructosamine kinase family protein [Chryseolinea lacunae]|uniref:Fructosamine kinase family protein n=1 Tax=Chryseolinea lacunae TaxID=2801331 RepID=A0ABS1KSK2_9BACT|nr:fructosamine kinase family protein [Chryseolinea lacunae]MBL0741667.1 fructosamine kinase family protein [Chryseolinea lacunae]